MINADAKVFLPESFTYLSDPRFIISMNYATIDNFLGRIVQGYERKCAILTIDAANALKAVQDSLDLHNKGYRLKIFDAYRPTQAVDDFMQWSNEEIDLQLQQKYFPDYQKKQLYEKGYLAPFNSTHSRGSTVDLTLCVPSKEDANKYVELNMGTIFDFFGEKSHTDFPFLSDEAKTNRQLLKLVMKQQHFKNYEKEWWHFTLLNEPFPSTYFNFPVK